jgi:outer membrane lipoprotein-sorting protein
MFSKVTAMAFLIILTLFSVSLFGQESLTGEEIIKNVYQRGTPHDQTGSLVMTLENSRGSKRVREIDQYLKDFGSEEKKIMFFTAPADVKGTSFMNWSYDDEGRDDDQWIYLPALKKVKRISSGSRGDAFMGSDFTYDDLGDRHPSEDNHRLLRQETLQGEPCYVVESIPKDEDYMYARTVTWVAADMWIGLKKEFYDEDNDHLKTLTVGKYQNTNGYWMITKSEMHNTQKDHTTRIELKNIRLDTGIEDRIFTERIMSRGL